MTAEPRPCFDCGAAAQHEHHVVPRSMGGTRTVPLCEECHGKVHGRDLGTSALTKAALRVKRERGERVGAVPYGFTSDANGRLFPCEAEQGVLVIARSLRVGRSLRAVVDEMAKRGLVSRTGRPFQLTQVVRMVRPDAL